MPVGGAAEARRRRLIRRVVCVRGAMPFRARIAPRFGYGTDPHTLTETEAGQVDGRRRGPAGLACRSWRPCPETTGRTASARRQRRHVPNAGAMSTPTLYLIKRRRDDGAQAL